MSMGEHQDYTDVNLAVPGDIPKYNRLLCKEACSKVYVLDQVLLYRNINGRRREIYFSKLLNYLLIYLFLPFCFLKIQDLNKFGNCGSKN
jgi:hypothetical protein